jgi:MoaA/NifB/PqqE/SkfB family radical SAM enzyme
MLSKLKTEYPSRLKINYGFTATDQNTRELDSVFDTANKLNLGFFYKPILAPTKFEKREVSESESLSPESVSKIKAFSVHYEKKVKFNFLDRKIYKIFNNTLRRYLDFPERLVTCYAGSISCYITADGNVSPCLMLDDTMGNLNETDFDTLWHSANSNSTRNLVERSDCHCLTPCDTFPSIIVDKFPFYR